MKAGPKTPDEYLAGAPAEARAVLDGLRETIRSIAPDSEERISYGIIVFYLHRPLVGLGYFKNHLSFFPMGSDVLEGMKNELKRFDTSKGTIRFTVEDPISLALVKRIVKLRLKDNESRAKVSRPRKR